MAKRVIALCKKDKKSEDKIGLDQKGKRWVCMETDMDKRSTDEKVDTVQ